MQATEPSNLLSDAVYGHRSEGQVGLLDRLFARWFERLVYTQIWEDPVCDLEAMQVESHHRIITIASAGCNALAYLLADPAEAERCKVPDFAKAMGHEEKWKLHNNCK